MNSCVYVIHIRPTCIQEIKINKDGTKEVKRYEYDELNRLLVEEIHNKSVDNTVVEPQNYSRKPELVTLEVDTDTLSKIGVTLIITDNNETSYGWGKDYEVQKKENNNWINLEPSKPMIVQDIGYMLDENNQCKQNIDWSHYYGKLENGTYRIKKKVYDNKYIDLYSNEFEIK